MKSFFTTNNILTLILVGLVIYSILNTNTIKTDVNGYNKRIDSIQTKIDSAQVVRGNIQNKIDSVKTNVNTITTRIEHIDKSITIIKKQTDEKANTVDKFSNAELESFFTSRYNQSLHTN